ncbi:MAG TPA: GNAT family N-acetyltransferase [Conexibacter sp.]|nr:GNAT family N-acetyltransferase [Conexibacter sp.]
MSLDAEILTDRERIDALVPEWQALATACGEPLAAPTWVLTLSRELAGASQTPRIVTVREGGKLIGLAPLCVDLSQPRRAADYRLLAGDMPRTTLLAHGGREWEAADAVARVLADADPRADVLALESIPVATCWPIALAEQWPGRTRPLLRRYFTMSSPTVAMTQESFDAWLAAKSSNFRSQMRRMRRRFAEAGGSGRFSTRETLHDDWAAMVQLHAGRWEGRGASSIVAGGASLSAAYEAIGHELLEQGDFRLRVLEIDGKPISVQLFAAIGSEVIYINGGWDEEFAQFKPAMLGILDAIEDAFARGERRMDLGPGAQPYKLRFADGTDPVAWWVLIPPGRRMPLALARTLPRTTWRELRDAAKRSLSPERADRLRELRRRLP